ncbi:MAG TPA: hypothetical protein VHL11_09265, partial [Phototrophicaceae bacterium]|nr:hypothetical protein [Phototrophicaceae bacterium]
MDETSSTHQLVLRRVTDTHTKYPAYDFSCQAHFIYRKVYMRKYRFFLTLFLLVAVFVPAT